MDEPSHPDMAAAGTAPGYAKIASRGEYHQVLRDAFEQAAALRCREILMCDEHFADWPLNEAGVVEHLAQWASPQRKLTVLARRFDEVARLHPRFVAWRRTWSHAVECRANHDLESGQIPTLLLIPGLLTLKLVDTVNYRGSVSRHAGDAVLARELFDSVLERSEHAFPATQLGL
jgi:hypothetical protein